MKYSSIKGPNIPSGMSKFSRSNETSRKLVSEEKTELASAG